MPIHETTHCLFCEAPRGRGDTCGDASCRGALYRRHSETKYNLRAFDEWSLDMAYALVAHLTGMSSRWVQEVRLYLQANVSQTSAPQHSSQVA